MALICKELINNFLNCQFVLVPVINNFVVPNIYSQTKKNTEKHRTFVAYNLITNFHISQISCKSSISSCSRIAVYYALIPKYLPV